MADRRAYDGKIVANADGTSSFGERTLGADTTKAVLSDDARDIFGIAGSSPAFAMVHAVRGLHADAADGQLFARVQPPTPLAWALDGKVAPIPNTVVHSYRVKGRLVCCRTDWSPTLLSRQILLAAREVLTITVAGSGTEHFLPFAQRDPARLAETLKLVNDVTALRGFLLEGFAHVAKVDPGVGPDLDAWMFERADVSWRKVNDVLPK